MSTNRPKLYEVIKATKRETLKGVEVGGKQYKFGRLGNMRISDPGVAREIEKRWGSYTKGGTKEVVVAEVDAKWDLATERGHNYTFHMPAMPWAKYDERGRRIKGDSDVTQAVQASEEHDGSVLGDAGHSAEQARAAHARRTQRQSAEHADAADESPGERRKS